MSHTTRTQKLDLNEFQNDFARGSSGEFAPLLTWEDRISRGSAFKKSIQFNANECGLKLDRSIN